MEKSTSKVEYMSWTGETRKSVIKGVENKWIMKNLESLPHIALDVQDTTHVYVPHMYMCKILFTCPSNLGQFK